MCTLGNLLDTLIAIKHNLEGLCYHWLSEDDHPLRLPYKSRIPIHIRMNSDVRTWVMAKWTLYIWFWPKAIDYVQAWKYIIILNTELLIMITNANSTWNIIWGSTEIFLPFVLCLTRIWILMASFYNEACIAVCVFIILSNIVRLVSSYA